MSFCSSVQYICFVHKPRCPDMWAFPVQVCFRRLYVWDWWVWRFLAMDIIVATSPDLYKVCRMSTMLCMVLHRGCVYRCKAFRSWLGWSVVGIIMYMGFWAQLFAAMYRLLCYQSPQTQIGCDLACFYTTVEHLNPSNSFHPLLMFRFVNKPNTFQLWRSANSPPSAQRRLL